MIDFIQEGVSNRGNHLLEANPGGAPCNVLAMPSIDEINEYLKRL